MKVDWETRFVYRLARELGKYAEEIEEEMSVEEYDTWKLLLDIEGQESKNKGAR